MLHLLQEGGNWGQTLESGPVLQLESYLKNLNKAWLESSIAFQIKVINLNMDGNIKISIWMIQDIVTKRNTGNLSAWDWITNKALSPSLNILPHLTFLFSLPNDHTYHLSWQWLIRLKTQKKFTESKIGAIFFGKLPHESPQKIWKLGNEGILS